MMARHTMRGMGTEAGTADPHLLIAPVAHHRWRAIFEHRPMRLQNRCSADGVGESEGCPRGPNMSDNQLPSCGARTPGSARPICSASLVRFLISEFDALSGAAESRKRCRDATVIPVEGGESGSSVLGACTELIAQRNLQSRDTGRNCRSIPASDKAALVARTLGILGSATAAVHMG
jgi:hypothetical protein